jgi:hydroxymethylpyrimidine pyrophosphatase-like HAD family hydrolase
MEFKSKINQPITWILDLDGTLVKHNGHLTNDENILPGVLDFFNKIQNDFIIITTARSEKYKKQTIDFLKKNGLRFDVILFNLPPGERVLINDQKPDGTNTSYSFNVERNKGLNIN